MLIVKNLWIKRMSYTTKRCRRNL